MKTYEILKSKRITVEKAARMLALQPKPSVIESVAMSIPEIVENTGQ